MKEIKENFNTKYPTYIIAFSPDSNSFFVTNERFFFWESDEEFKTEEEGIQYFEHNINHFLAINNKIMDRMCNYQTDKVWLENTRKFYYGY